MYMNIFQTGIFVEIHLTKFPCCLHWRISIVLDRECSLTKIYCSILLFAFLPTSFGVLGGLCFVIFGISCELIFKLPVTPSSRPHPSARKENFLHKVFFFLSILKKL